MCLHYDTEHDEVYESDGEEETEPTAEEIAAIEAEIDAEFAEYVPEDEFEETDSTYFQGADLPF